MFSRRLLNVGTHKLSLDSRRRINSDVRRSLFFIPSSFFRESLGESLTNASRRGPDSIEKQAECIFSMSKNPRSFHSTFTLFSHIFELLINQIESGESPESELHVLVIRSQRKNI